MPRDDIHNADDLANVIRREVASQIIRTGMNPNAQRERNIEPIMVMTMAAIKGTIGPEAQTDFDLLRARTFNPRISAPIERVRETARFRR